ncbi:MAG TPA: ABC transporter substrate-binding protein [Cellulomonas sp.]
MRKRLRVLSATAVVGLLALVAACSSESSADDESASASGSDAINIALIVPLTGDAALEGENAVNAATLAVEQIAADGGPTVTFDQLDDQADATASANIASQQVDRYQNGEIDAVVGLAWSGLALADNPLLEAAGVPTIGTTPSNPSISEQGWTNWLRMVQSDEGQANQLSAFAVNNLGATKVAILYSNNDYGVGIKDYQVESLETLGADLVAEETFTPSEDTDFTTQLTNIKASGAEAIILDTGYTEGGLIMRQAEQLGLDLPVVASGNNLYQDFIDLADGAAEGAYVLTVFDSFSEDATTKAFADTYQERFGSLPAEGAYTTYDAFLAIAQAYEDGATSDTLIDSLKTSGFTGAGGSYAWDDAGDVADKPLAVIEVEDGEFASSGLTVDTTGL